MRQPNADHIIEWNVRRGIQSGLSFDVRIRIKKLEEAWRESPRSYLAEFITMRISTCIEVCVRELIRELVDAGNPYADSARKLVKHAKLDLVFAEHLVGKRLSVGDFVAHSVSIHSIDAIISCLSTLIVDFDSKLKTSHARWTEDEHNWPLGAIIEDYDRTIGALAKMFEVRNILTHELPDALVTDGLDIEGLCKAARVFVEACDWVVVAELHGSVPYTQTAMNISKDDSLKEVRKSLEATVAEAAILLGIDTEKLREVQSLWHQFSDAEASLIASQFEGGSIYPMRWSSAKTSLSADRIKQLRQLIDGWRMIDGG